MRSIAEYLTLKILFFSEVLIITINANRINYCKEVVKKRVLLCEYPQCAILQDLLTTKPKTCDNCYILKT